MLTIQNTVSPYTYTRAGHIPVLAEQFTVTPFSLTFLSLHALKCHPVLP